MMYYGIILFPGSAEPTNQMWMNINSKSYMHNDSTQSPHYVCLHTQMSKKMSFSVTIKFHTSENK